MSARTRWQHLPTEAVSRLYGDIDLLSADKMVEAMVLDSKSALQAVQAEKVSIVRGSELIAAAIRRGGRIVFIGAGTSGRLGVLEAAELPPTFGIEPSRSPAIMAGGLSAVHRAREGVEDDEREGSRAMRALRPRSDDVVVGISASGLTPFVRGGMSRARAAGARTILVTCDARSELKRLADVAITLNVGPEIIAGSTRLKAGTATKLVLNTLTTTAMVQSGKTLGNLMVDVRPGSDKLRDRACRIVSRVTGLDSAGAKDLLGRAGWNVKVAILMRQSGVTRRIARLRLREEPRLRKHLGGKPAAASPARRRQAGSVR